MKGYLWALLCVALVDYKRGDCPPLSGWAVSGSSVSYTGDLKGGESNAGPEQAGLGEGRQEDIGARHEANQGRGLLSTGGPPVNRRLCLGPQDRGSPYIGKFVRKTGRGHQIR